MAEDNIEDFGLEATSERLLLVPEIMFSQEAWEEFAEAGGIRDGSLTAERQEEIRKICQRYVEARLHDATTPSLHRVEKEFEKIINALGEAVEKLGPLLTFGLKDEEVVQLVKVGNDDGQKFGLGDLEYLHRGCDREKNLVRDEIRILIEEHYAKMHGETGYVYVAYHNLKQLYAATEIAAHTARSEKHHLNRGYLRELLIGLLGVHRDICGTNKNTREAKSFTASVCKNLAEEMDHLREFVPHELKAASEEWIENRIKSKRNSEKY